MRQVGRYCCATDGGGGDGAWTHQEAGGDGSSIRPPNLRVELALRTDVVRGRLDADSAALFASHPDCLLGTPASVR